LEEEERESICLGSSNEEYCSTILESTFLLFLPKLYFMGHGVEKGTESAKILKHKGQIASVTNRHYVHKD